MTDESGRPCLEEDGTSMRMEAGIGRHPLTEKLSHAVFHLRLPTGPPPQPERLSAGCGPIFSKGDRCRPSVRWTRTHRTPRTNMTEATALITCASTHPRPEDVSDA